MTFYIVVLISKHLQAVVVRISLDKTITLCSVYIPPNSSLSLAQLKNIGDQCIIMRHSALRGNKTTNDKDNILENFSHSRNCVSLTMVLIHTCICLLGMCLIQQLILLLLTHLFFQSSPGKLMAISVEVIILQSLQKS